MSLIDYTVENSCITHPLITASSLPKAGKIRVTPRRLFVLGSLIMQDSSVGRDSLKETQQLWQNRHGDYIVYLTFPSKNILTKAFGERLTDLSEIVGIACGLAVLKSESQVNLNRLQRFEPKSKKRRADFQFYKDGFRYFHECKGITYKSELSRARNAVLMQKKGTDALQEEK